jgi:UrcA family protein
MLIKYRLSAAIVAAALGLAASAYSASAGSDPDKVSVTVKLADLNLGAHSGAQAAFRRIRFAAQSICGEQPAPMELGVGQQYRQCVDTAVRGAVERLGNPIVAAIGHVGSGATFASR